MGHIDVRLGGHTLYRNALAEEEITDNGFLDFYEIVALREPLPKDFVSSQPSPTREQVAEKIQGKVLGWGLWVGSYERKWE